MKIQSITAAILASISLSLPACNKIEEWKHQLTGQPQLASATPHEPGAQHAEAGAHDEAGHHGEAGQHEEAEGHGGEHHPQHKILVTSPVAKDVVSSQPYVCQIHSRRHIEVCALEGGYIQDIPVQEGQSVKEGDLLFKILPGLYQAKLETDMAEAQLAHIKFNNTQKLYQQNVVSNQEVALAQAELAKANAKVKLAQAELNFADVKAPFDGIVDRLHRQKGSLVEEGDVLTTMSDNSVMWVYFNVPEAHYIEYKTAMDQGKADQDLELDLILANHKKFPQTGKIAAIEADFNNMLGTVAFRADFPNPNGLLRHGQTGTILINHVLRDAVVIPQRATYEILAKRYAYVVDDEGVVHQQEIEIETELDDVFVIRSGLKIGDKIILEGIRQVRDGDKIEYEFRDPEEVLSNLKYPAQ